jgi:hypothetical protein
VRVRVKKPTVSEQMNKSVSEKVQKYYDQYNKETDPKRKIDLKYKMGRKIVNIYFAEILSLTDKDFGSFLKEQFKDIQKAFDDLGKDYVDKRMSRGEMNLQDIELLAYEGQTLDRFSKGDFIDLSKSKLSQKNQLARMMLLSVLSMTQSAVKEAYLTVALEPLVQLNNLVNRRFGADGNWSTAVAILATHENLVKRKLRDLGISEAEIEKTSKEGGLNPLVSQLVKLIKLREKRDVSLEFYKASGLRNVRNELEHRGYALKVSHDEMRNILKDVLRFEAELFPPAAT